METVNIGLTDNIAGIIQHILYVGAGTGALTVLVIALGTKGILDLFLKRKLDISTPRYLREHEKDILFSASAFIAVTYVPIIAIFMMVTGPANTNFYIIGLLALLSFIGYKSFGNKIKDKLKFKNNLTTNSLVAIMQVISTNAATFVQSTVIHTINLVLEVVHKLFVYNYAVVAIILNMLLTILVMKVMGSSGEAGKLNLIGSLFGAVIHAISVRNKLPKLRAALEEEDKLEAEKEKEYEKTHNSTVNS